MTVGGGRSCATRRPRASHGRTDSAAVISHNGDTGAAQIERPHRGGRRAVRVRRLRRHARRAEVQVRARSPTSRTWPPGPSSTPSGPWRAWASSGPNEDECVGIPDLAALTVLPWDTRYALAPADLYLHGQPYTPRLPPGAAAARWRRPRHGLPMPTMGVEPEVYVLRQVEGDDWVPFVAEDLDNLPTRGYDLEATMLADAFLEPMVDHMNDARLGRLLLRPRGRRRPVRVRLRLHRRPGHGRPDGDLPADGQARRPLAGLHRHLHAQAVRQTAFGSGAHLNISLADPASGTEPVRGRGRRAGHQRASEPGRPRLQRARLPVHRRGPRARRAITAVRLPDGQLLQAAAAPRADERDLLGARCTGPTGTTTAP